MNDERPHPESYDLLDFSLAEMSACQALIRKMGKDTDSMEEAAERIVRFFHDRFSDKNTGKNCFVLVRFFKTHTYGDLDGELQAFARSELRSEDIPFDVKCLTLLASAGEDPAWNSRSESRGHKTFPLTSEQAVERFPMMMNLFKQLGVELKSVVKPDPALLADLSQRSYNVFHVPEAQGSPYIPSQEEFVIPRGVKSVLGFGGVLPLGDLFTIIMFSRVPVRRQVALLFQAIALAAKIAILPFERSVFR